MASSQDTSVSFEPSAAVPAIPGSGEYAVEQINRPPLVVYTLGLRCACGARLCGCEYWFFADSLHARGVCLKCGEQAVIFAPPRVHRDSSAVQHHAEVATHEMIAAVSDLLAWTRNDDRDAGTLIATSDDTQRIR